MRKGNKFTCAILMICVVLVFLVEKSMNSSNSSVDWIDIQMHKKNSNMFWELDFPATQITKFDGLKREAYGSPNKKYVLVKDLSSSSEVTLCVSDKTRNLEFSYNELRPYSKGNINYIYTLCYSETEENENIMQTLHANSPLEKKIFVVPHYRFERDILINRIEAAKDKDQHEVRQIEQGMEYLLRLISVMICKKYIKEDKKKLSRQIQVLFNILQKMEISEIELKQMIKKSPKSCSLLGKVMFFNDINSKTLKTLEYSEKVLDEILEEKRLVRPDKIQETFDIDTDTLTNQLNYSEEIYNNCKLEDMQEIVMNDTFMYINILSNEKLGPYIAKGREKPEEDDEFKQIKHTDEETNENLDMLSIIDEEGLKYEIEVWNRHLLEMLIARAKRISDSSQDITRENVCDENRALIEEVKGKRKECYNERKDITILEGIFRRDIAQIKEILESRKRKPSTTDRNTIRASIENANKQIIDILSKIAEKDPNDLSESAKKREKIENILVDIEKKVSVSGNKDTILEIISEKKQSIIDVILEPLPSTKNKDAIRIKNQLEHAIIAIVDDIVKEKIDLKKLEILTLLKKEIEKEERNITQNSIDDLMSIHCLVKKFAYRGNAARHFLYAIDGYDIRILNFLQMFNNNESACEWLIKNITPNDITRSNIICLYQFLYYIHSYIHNLRSYAMIWTNPAFLSINSNENSGCISYKSKLDGKIYKKTIILTEENIQAFRDAKTSEDIDKIEGSSEEIYIKCFDSNASCGSNCH